MHRDDFVKVKMVGAELKVALFFGAPQRTADRKVSECNAGTCLLLRFLGKRCFVKKLHVKSANFDMKRFHGS